jgi:hypothetical protein
MFSALSSSFNKSLIFAHLGFLVIGSIFTNSSVEAATVSFSLKFFDTSGAQIGNGSFSYDDSQPLEVDIPNPNGSAISIDENDNWYQLTSFSANIGGSTWNLNNLGAGDNYLSWVPSQGNSRASGTPKSIGGDPREAIVTELNQWAFGSQVFDERALFVSGTNEFGGNSPSFFLQPDLTNPPISGNWRAEPIPEPGILLGSVLGTAIVYQRQKKSRQKRR